MSDRAGFHAGGILQPHASLASRREEQHATLVDRCGVAEELQQRRLPRAGGADQHREPRSREFSQGSRFFVTTAVLKRVLGRRRILELAVKLLAPVDINA